MSEKSFFRRYIKIFVLGAVFMGAASSILARLTVMEPMAIGFWRLTMGLPFIIAPKAAEHFKSRAAGAAAAGARGAEEGARGALGSAGAQGEEGARGGAVYSVLSGAALFLHFLTWFTAVKMTNIASAATIASLHPLVVLLVSLTLLKKKVDRRAILGIIIAIAGAAMIAGFDYRQLAEGSIEGDFAALLAAVFFGIYFLLAAKARETLSGATHLFYCFGTCWVCFTAGMFVSGTQFFGYSAPDYIAIVFMTLICQIGSHAVFNICFKYVNPLYVSVVATLDPAIAIGYSIVFLRQFPTRFAVLGCIIVVAGLIAYNYFASEERAKE